MICVNILIDFWSFFVDFWESSVLINGVVHSTVFLLKLTVAIVVIFVVFKLVILTCSLIIVHPRLLRIGRLRIIRSVFFFVSLIVWLLRSILIRLIIQIQVCVFWCRLQQLMLIASKSLQWNHDCISRSLLITIRWEVLVHRTKRKRALRLTLNRTVWHRKRGLTIRRLILRLIWSLILTLTRKVRERMKVLILTISISFKLRASIITITVILLITHSIFIASVMLLHCSVTLVSLIDLKSSMLFGVQLFNKLSYCSLRSEFSKGKSKLTIQMFIG